MCLSSLFFPYTFPCISVSPSLNNNNNNNNTVISIALFTERPGAQTTSDVCSTK